MKGYVYAEGGDTRIPIRTVRQIFEFFKVHADPKKEKKLIFSLGEDEHQLVFHCLAVSGLDYYFAITFGHKVLRCGEWIEEPIFWISQKHVWDQVQNIACDTGLIAALPEGFIQADEEWKWHYDGSWQEGMAILESYGFVYCLEMEEKLCDEDW